MIGPTAALKQKSSFVSKIEDITSYFECAVP